jgi:pimeloyl-ACP methyl ester carboxylesterase
MRGEMIDIGGRRFRVVRQGMAQARPAVLFEAGSFGLSADWAAVQGMIGGRLRTIAYDRAGLGFSDPGPKPRDTRAIVSDLHKLLSAAGEAGPFVLVGHSMAAVHLYGFALRYPQLTAGLVLVDATPPAALADPHVTRIVKAYHRAASLKPLSAQLFLSAAASPVFGDMIDVPEPAKSEKRRFFASPIHNYWAAKEVKAWLQDGEQVRALGELDREVPVAVVTAQGGGAHWKRLQAEPAHRSRSGYAVNVRAANHASVLGQRHGEAVVKAIDFIVKAAAAHGLAAPRAADGS